MFGRKPNKENSGRLCKKATPMVKIPKRINRLFLDIILIDDEISDDRERLLSR